MTATDCRHRWLQGYLLKQTSDFRKAWKRRFFVLDSQGMLYYFSSKEGSRKEQAPRNTCNLLTATIKPGAEVGRAHAPENTKETSQPAHRSCSAPTPLACPTPPP